MAVAPEGQPAFDRKPPQNIFAERAVLGAMLINPEAVGAALEVLRESPSELFYAEAHQQIFAAILTLFRDNHKVDAVTVVEQLSRDGHLESAGGYTYLAELTGAVPTSASIDHYAKIVLDHAVLRRLISACTVLAGEAYRAEGEVSDLLDRAEAAIFDIAERRQINPIARVGNLLEDAIKRLEELIKSHSGMTGLATGFDALDELLSGLQQSDMIIVAARPSVGKTALVLNIASHVGVHLGKGALLFSLEMSKEQLMQRLICMEGQIDSRRLRTGFLAKDEFPKVTQAASRLANAPIFIDDTPNITILEIRSKARRHAAQHGLDLLIIDYLQLMTSGRRAESRQVEISEISRGIKGLARELRIPVIAVSQLSREAERDEKGLPKLFHLRESGAIEQDADVVLMLAPPPKEDAEERRDQVIVSIAKQRNGPTGTLSLLFDRQFQRFKNLATGASPGEPPPFIPQKRPYIEQAEQYEAEPVEGDEGVPF